MISIRWSVPDVEGYALIPLHAVAIYRVQRVYNSVVTNRGIWIVNLVVLLSMLGVLSAGLCARNPWIDVVIIAIYVLGALGCFVVQIAWHRGGTELTRAQWIWGPHWWRRFATDDLENPKLQRGLGGRFPNLPVRGDSRHHGYHSSPGSAPQS